MTNLDEIIAETARVGAEVEHLMFEHAVAACEMVDQLDAAVEDARARGVLVVEFFPIDDRTFEDALDVVDPPSADEHRARAAERRKANKLRQRKAGG